MPTFGSVAVDSKTEKKDERNLCDNFGMVSWGLFFPEKKEQQKLNRTRTGQGLGIVNCVGISEPQTRRDSIARQFSETTQKERFSTDPQHEGRSLAENVSPFSGKKDTVLRGKEFYASVKKNVWPTANLHSLTRKIRQSGAFM